MSETVGVRLLLARWEEGDTPSIVAAVDETIWEHWEEADERKWRDDAARTWGIEATDVEWREVRATFEADNLKAAFATPEVVGTVEA